MASINKVFLMGRLTRDPEQKFTTGGKSVVSFGIAVDRRVSRSAPEGAQTADFFNVTAWERTADFVNDYFRKGSLIIVEGRLQYRSWEAQDGSKRSTVEVVADQVQFGESKRPDGQGGQHGGQGERPASGGPRSAEDVGGSAPDEDDFPF